MLANFGETENAISDIPKRCQTVTEGWQSSFGVTDLKLGMTDFSRVWNMAEVVHLGGTEFAESVCPRLLMSVLSSEEC